MAFRTNPAPYQRRKSSTLQIMLILCIALAIVWVFGIIYSFKLDGIIEASGYIEKFNKVNKAKIDKGTIEALVAPNYGLRAILMVVVSLVVTAICDVLTTIIRHNKNGKVSLGQDIVHNLIHNYSYVTAIIYALTLPVYVSYYVVIIGAVFATVVVKNLFGGFGRNIFNPAIMARIFVGLCFVNSFNVPEILVNANNAGIDAVTGATLTTAFNSTGSWLATSYVSNAQTIKGAIFADYTLVDMLTGQYVGALGETFTLVIFVLGIALSVLKVINWRTPAFYLGTVALTSLAIALFCGFSNPLQYVLYHLCLGGVMFGAVFMLTDPVTGPTSPFGKCLIGGFAGFMTVLIRVKGGYPEGVMFSIALCNFISPAIDYLTTGKSNSNLIKKICFAAGIVVLSIGLNGAIAVKANGGKEVYEIYGMDAATYTQLATDIGADDNYKIQLNSSYSIKDTAHIKAYYELVNKDTNVVEGYVFEVTGDVAIDTGYGNQTIKPTVYVTFDKDGKVINFNSVKAPCTTGYKTNENINEYVDGIYVGKDASVLDTTFDNLAGATYSSAGIKDLFKYAFDEFEGGRN